MDNGAYLAAQEAQEALYERVAVLEQELAESTRRGDAAISRWNALQDIVTSEGRI